MQITHFGHACVLVEIRSTRVLIDPGNLSTAWQQLDDVDAVLLTHTHRDHVDVEPLQRLLSRTTSEVTVWGPAAVVSQFPEAATVSVSTADRWAVGGILVEAFPGEHAQIHVDIPTVPNVGYVLRAEGEPSFFHPGDSLTQIPADVDVLAIPLHGPWAAMGDVIDFVRAVGAVDGFGIHEQLLSERGYYLSIHRYDDMSTTTVHDVKQTPTLVF